MRPAGGLVAREFLYALSTFLEIAATHYGDLRAYAHQLSHDYDAAEDALQHCLVNCANTWPAERPITDLAVRRYLGRSIKNRLRPSRQRKEPRKTDVTQLSLREQPVAPEPVGSVEARYNAEIARDYANHDLIRDILLSLGELPVEQAECYRLTLAGFNQKQVAERLGIAHVRAHRAVKAAESWVRLRFGEQYAALQVDDEADPFDFEL